MTHQKMIGTENPGLIVLLIDQSSSMKDAYGDSSKAQIAADAVNSLIYEIQEASYAGSTIKPRCRVAVIGYGAEIKVIASAMINELAEHYTTTRRVSKQLRGEQIEFEVPVWVEPTAVNGTPMREAFERALELISDWAAAQQNSYPPVVINITDGEPNDMSGARRAAAAISAIRTLDGEALLFNVHVSSRQTGEIVLPSSAANLDEFGTFLFDISSPLPETLLAQGHSAGFAPQAGARGFVYNASPETLIKLLAFGSMNLR
ncbi:MAG: VWA domain-containing protein [Anaerolinea sp.]|nr:VWA domain-containing protein [Anaerolinea sp.]